MSKQPETKFKEKVITDLKKLPNTWFTKIQQLAKSGDPDFACCINGMFVAIELKKDAKSKPSPLQQWVLEAIVEAGGIACVANPENWKSTLEELTKLANGDPDASISSEGSEGKFVFNH